MFSTLIIFNKVGNWSTLTFIKMEQMFTHNYTVYTREEKFYYGKFVSIYS